MIKRRCLILLFSLILPAIAQSEDLQVGGYLKSLLGFLEIPRGTDPPVPGRFQYLLHHRLNIRYYPSFDWKFACDLRTRFIYQKNLNPSGLFTRQLRRSEDLVDLTLVIVDEEDALLVSQIDRLYADWTTGSLQVTAGRQRIAWGTNLVWNPTDLFNPYDVLDFDYEERPGTDAVRAQYFLGPASRVEVAFAPGERSLDRTGLGLVGVNFWEYDVNFLGGTFQEGLVLGISWAGSMWGGGFRGEARAIRDQTVPDVETGLPSKISYLTAALSGDYTFSNSLYIHTELLYNGDGVTEDAGLRWPVALARGQFTPARWSIYQGFSYDLSPLVRGSVFGLINPSDGSFVAVPSISWSLLTNWDLYFIALLPTGRPATEFGGYGSAAFTRVKWSF